MKGGGTGERGRVRERPRRAFTDRQGSRAVAAAREELQDSSCRSVRLEVGPSARKVVRYSFIPTQRRKKKKKRSFSSLSITQISRLDILA